MQQNPLVSTESEDSSAGSVDDIDFLISMKPWQWHMNFDVPYDYLSSIGSASVLETWVVLLEPLSSPDWSGVRQWYLDALYNSAEQLQKKSNQYQLKLNSRNSSPVAWQSILKLAESHWSEKKNKRPSW